MSDSKTTVSVEDPAMPTQTALLDDSHVAPTFAELGVSAPIVAALAADNKIHSFAIQELTLPLALAGSDLIGQARTGMGKTYGFGIPLLDRISRTENRGDLLPLDTTPRALVIVPTRELCLQVFGDLKVAAKQLTVETSDHANRPVKLTAIYGGRPYDSQIAELQAGVDVVVGTPGRLLDLAQQGHLVLGKVQILVLDEADEMLDLGFLPDIERIMAALPEKRQTMLFSATMPGPIVTLARTFLNKPTHIRAEQVHDSAVHERTAQYVYRAHALDKMELVSRVLQSADRGATMIFTRTKRTAQKVADDLSERGFAVAAVHGDLGQVAREKALKRFRTGGVDVLVATDVAARGIDIDDVTHVINYQCPEDEKTYVHRIGRTGRAGRTGIAVTLVDWDELHRWESINKALGLNMPDPAETYSSSAHLREELNIPTDITGRVAKPAPNSESAASQPRTIDSDATAGRTRAPRNRQRRRTRAGQPSTGETAQTGAASSAAASAETTGATSESAEGSTRSPRKRRRRRTGASAASTSAPSADSTSSTGGTKTD